MSYATKNVAIWIAGLALFTAIAYLFGTAWAAWILVGVCMIVAAMFFFNGDYISETFPEPQFGNPNPEPLSLAEETLAFIMYAAFMLAIAVTCPSLQSVRRLWRSARPSLSQLEIPQAIARRRK